LLKLATLKEEVIFVQF